MTELERTVLEHLYDNEAGLTLHDLMEDLDNEPRDVHRALSLLLRNELIHRSALGEHEPKYAISLTGKFWVRTMRTSDTRTGRERSWWSRVWRWITG
ncbi:MAG TPA: hypothetical protein VHL57_09615 [Flavobacteriales bacterium]|jgi:DNA-binding MarR family transcriptional regulator|nr:hypothetical protein [Flavobacteriales bacterium]